MSSTCRAAWCSSMLAPLITGAPASSAATASGVGQPA